jgi:hypothetical protein
MKKVILTIAAASLALSSAFANLGDTYEQSIARYGQPQNTENTPAGVIRWVIDADRTVCESFGATNRCDAIWYNNFAGITPSEILTKITFNVPNTEYFQEFAVPQGRFWSTQSGSVTAYLSVIDNGGKGRNPFVLSIWSAAHHQAVEAAKVNVNYN